ncbi:uncharacterized protein B0H18DRAFT_1121990 [Fomitopsis serialis]|uniref:uncharacterized protein n=1 Tax=Fomitopsis serialis TaxID=139415 RepID=UPI002007D023|nr:uncharacterized protein B0H18DRAFT_1121990 [Neoantrodia serialis]KAH9920397.1 hypothetical protein B0H18DRAFT_1121990 [Neoantrodia serialis]
MLAALADEQCGRIYAEPSQALGDGTRTARRLATGQTPSTLNGGAHGGSLGEPLIAAADSGFAFRQLLAAAIAREDEGLFSEGEDCEPIPLGAANAQPAPSSRLGLVHTPFSAESSSLRAEATGSSAESDHPGSAAGTVGACLGAGSRSIERQRRKAQVRAKRKRQRAESASPYATMQRPRLPLLNRHIDAAPSIGTDIATQALPHSNGAYTGGREPRTSRRQYTLDDLVGEGSEFGFELIRWDGRTPRPITDESGRVIAVLSGAPNDPAWTGVHTGAAAAISEARTKLSFSRKDVVHRRGNFPALAVGISYGGGQKQPANLVHSRANEASLTSLLASEHIQRIASFGSNVFSTWAPRLFNYYVSGAARGKLPYPRRIS